MPQLTPFHAQGVASLSFQLCKTENGSVRILYLKESKRSPSVLSPNDWARSKRRNARTLHRHKWRRSKLWELMMMMHGDPTYLLHKIKKWGERVRREV